jgi:L-ascorbate metabolism protein UlaG (beta-lactamase superfamily)
LIPKVKKVVTSLGVGEHLEHWGFAPEIITELDWWQTTTIDNDINITATLARHFSGRGIKRATSLWSSFVLNLNGYRLFLGGDSGYGTHFKTIGEKFGPFDLAILENGQYGHNWPTIHTMPEETVLAAQDLQAKIVLPVHWGKFVLSTHPWNEPIKRFIEAANKAQLAFATPKIGEPYVIGGKVSSDDWWEF